MQTHSGAGLGETKGKLLMNRAEYKILGKQKREKTKMSC